MLIPATLIHIQLRLPIDNMSISGIRQSTVRKSYLHYGTCNFGTELAYSLFMRKLDAESCLILLTFLYYRINIHSNN